MKKLYISFNNIDLGYLFEKNNKYVFVADSFGISCTESSNPVCLKLFSLNRTGKKEFDFLPKEFEKFLPSAERTDLILKAGILKQDSQFEKLYKLSRLEIMPNPFKIHQ